MNFLKALLSIPRLFKEELDYLNEDKLELHPDIVKEIEESRSGIECSHIWECKKCETVCFDEDVNFDDLSEYDVD